MTPEQRKAMFASNIKNKRNSHYYAIPDLRDDKLIELYRREDEKSDHTRFNNYPFAGTKKFPRLKRKTIRIDERNFT